MWGDSTLCAHRYTQVRKTRKTGPKRKYLTECIPRGRRLAGDGVSSVTDRSLQKKHRRQAASHSPWSQQYSGITLSTGMGMIGVPEITLIVPHAMGTISVEADLCITMSAEHGNDQCREGDRAHNLRHILTACAGCSAVHASDSHRRASRMIAARCGWPCAYWRR